jgi:RNA polymerase sigma-70 factor (ECF subfamily)
LLLLTDARRPARIDALGRLVLLEQQDRSLWDHASIIEGERLLTTALCKQRPGAFQIWAAIAACHSTAAEATMTDWLQIALLYTELSRFEQSPVIEANRAIAVAMVDGPEAGLAILDSLADGELAGWAPLHIARGDLLHRLGDDTASQEALRHALGAAPSEVQTAFIHQRLDELADPSSAPVGRPRAR